MTVSSRYLLCNGPFEALMKSVFLTFKKQSWKVEAKENTRAHFVNYVVDSIVFPILLLATRREEQILIVGLKN